MTTLEMTPAVREDRRTQQRDIDAMVRQGLPIVQYIVTEIARRVPRSVSRDDLVSAGMLGLTQAALAWDADRGVAFEGFARSRIRGAILDELRSSDWASRSVRARGRALQRATETLATSLGRTPTNGEVAEELGVDGDTVDRLHDDIRRATVLSYDMAVTDTEGIGAVRSPDAGPVEQLLSRERLAYLHDAVLALPERLRTVVIEYFFDERPMQAIADDLGVTESRVSQMRSEALVLLKDGMNAQLDPDEVNDLGVMCGRVGRRKTAYYAAVAAASDHRTRVAIERPSLHDRLAQIA